MQLDAKQRSHISLGIEVAIVLKKDQASGRLTYGIVEKLLTNSKYHPHGIKVRLECGAVGRVQKIME